MAIVDLTGRLSGIAWLPQFAPAGIELPEAVVGGIRFRTIGVDGEALFGGPLTLVGETISGTVESIRFSTTNGITLISGLAADATAVFAAFAEAQRQTLDGLLFAAADSFTGTTSTMRSSPMPVMTVLTAAQAMTGWMAARDRTR